ncbi:MAG: hypothetical protein EOP19_08510 [Hyphomicrobiales bacterium]|nr:MAG: hypothetical protein EOP19_08510 [Hyphomicrobiales bacterium]
MNCPQCEATSLVMAERAGVEIDYCPKCRGVWLDRGELDKIIDRAGAETPQAVPAAPPMQQQQYQQQPYQQSPQQPYYGKKPDDSHYGDPSPHGHRKKKSWLSEIFD